MYQILKEILNLFLNYTLLHCNSNFTLNEHIIPLRSEPLAHTRLQHTTSTALRQSAFSRLLHPLADCSSRRVARPLPSRVGGMWSLCGLAAAADGTFLVPRPPTDWAAVWDSLAEPVSRAWAKHPQRAQVGPLELPRSESSFTLRNSSETLEKYGKVIW